MNPILHIRKVTLGLSQADFAAIAGVSQGTVSKWETDELVPDRNELARMRAAVKDRGLAWDDSWFFEVPASSEVSQ